MERTKCTICNNNIIDIVTLNNYPISFSMTTDNNYAFENLVFTECVECKTVQTKKLIDLNVLYDKPHNNNVIGKTWIEHFTEFSSMINKIIKKDSIVLEIGSPSDKIVKNIENYLHWYLLDPNAHNYKNDKKITSINEFFTDKTVLDYKVDMIIHSHLLEHLYNPYETLLNMCNILKDNGEMCISVPNLGFYATNTLLLGLHFEHTYFLNESNIIFLLHKCGLKIIKKQYYKSHSIFYHLKKHKNYTNIPIESVKEYNMGYKSLLTEKIDYFKTNLTYINSIISEKENVFIFGCHSNTQAMLYFGLNCKKITYILDNDPEKWDKYFYGYDLICKSSNIISSVQDPFVICNVGVYSNEIKSQLLKLNNKVEFLNLI